MDEIISYFRALLDDDPNAENWWVWLNTHEYELEKSLTPGEILRLKHEGLEEVRVILERHGYSCPRLSKDFYLRLRPKLHSSMTDIPKEWLIQKIPVDEIEREVHDDAFGICDLNILKDKMQDGDEFWYFRSPQKTWANKMGRSGYALIRAGVPVDGMIMTMN